MKDKQKANCDRAEDKNKNKWAGQECRPAAILTIWPKIYSTTALTTAVTTTITLPFGQTSQFLAKL